MALVLKELSKVYMTWRYQLFCVFIGTAATGALAIQNMQADRQKSSESGQMNNSLMSQSNNTSAAPPSQGKLSSKIHTPHGKDISLDHVY